VRAARLIWAGVMALAAGCGWDHPRAPTMVADDAGFALPVKVEPPGLPAEPPAPYVLLPGDVVHLRTASVDPMDLSDLLIDGAGHVHLPLAGDVDIGGLGLTEAEKRIERALQVYDRYVRASLELTHASGHRATVVGAVNRPGQYELKPNVRVAEILAEAGGFKTFDTEGETYDAADLDAARILRKGVVLPISLSLAIQGDPRHNVEVRAGDLVFVPPSRNRRVTILGEVRSPRLAPFRQGMRLTEALALAGGTTKDSDDADIRILRGPLSSPRVYRADLKALVAGRAGDVELAAGDIVFVTEHWFATATDVVNRLAPVLAAVAFPATLLNK
jgi:polysaccharide export outer membrane protein